MSRLESTPRHFSMIRGFQLADFLTLGNAACGVASVLLAMQFLVSGDSAHFYWAAAMAPLAGAFDVADGRVARARQQIRHWGASSTRWPTSSRSASARRRWASPSACVAAGTRW